MSVKPGVLLGLKDVRVTKILRLDDHQTPPEDVEAGEPLVGWYQRLLRREEGAAQTGYAHSSSYERWQVGGPYFEWGFSWMWTNMHLGAHVEVDLWGGDPSHPRREERVYLTIGLGPLAWGASCTWWRNGNPDADFARAVARRAVASVVEQVRDQRA